MTDYGALDPDIANAIWSILVDKADASESDRETFVANQSVEHLSEWRFIGSLGFGGKFWRNSGTLPDGTWGETWYVSCYPENETPARRKTIEATNQALADLRASLAPRPR